MTRSDQGSAKHFASSRTYALLLGCIFIAAFLGEGSIGALNRTLIEMPAWRHLGVSTWAAFSQWADLGPGLILYPSEAIGSTLFTLLAAVIFFLNRRRMPRSLALPISAAVLCVLGIWLATTQAAPTMLSTPHLHDLTSLQQAFNRFAFWDGVRAVFIVCYGVANLWGLVLVSPHVFSGSSLPQTESMLPSLASEAQEGAHD
jgi:hypothetical protein